MTYPSARLTDRVPQRPFRVRFLLRRDDLDIMLCEGQILIGSSPSCNVVLRHPTVSARHARLAVTPDGLAVTDLDSRHGVFVNGVRVTGETTLVGGDLVTFGELGFGVFALDDLLSDDIEDNDGPTRVDFTSPFAE